MRRVRGAGRGDDRGTGDVIYPRIYVRCAGVQCAVRGVA